MKNEKFIKIKEKNKMNLAIATLAPIVNCIQLFPQLYKTYKTKHVKDLSFEFLCLSFSPPIYCGYFKYHGRLTSCRRSHQSPSERVSHGIVSVV